MNAKLKDTKVGFGCVENAATRALVEFLATRWSLPEGFEPYVYAFRDLDGGLRVSEFGASAGGAGCAIMRSDWDAAAEILAVEEWLLNWRSREDSPEGAGDLQDAGERLLALLQPPRKAQKKEPRR